MEFMEGIISLVAVGVLLYMGFWLHSKTEITRWKSFIDDRVNSAIENKNLLALGLMSFVAVFRESLETVLFLRAIWIEGGDSARIALLLGVLSAFAAMILLSWMLLKYASRIPVRQVFEASSALMVVLAVVLIGKGFHALQQNGNISITNLPLPRIDLLGFYPSVETTLAQICVLGVSLWLWFAGKRPIKSHPMPG